MNFFLFTKKDYDRFVDEGMLNKYFARLLELKIKGYSRVEIALKLNCSESKIDKDLKELKEKIKKLL